MVIGVPEARPAPVPPTVFISYSWDDEPHTEWVRGLAARLRGDGVDVTLDQWELQPGDRLPAFMEAAIREHDYILIVCTPHYRERSDAREGGVGYEGDIMTGELLTGRNERKFIPVLRRGDTANAVPTWLSGKYHADMRDGAEAERSYRDLLTTLLGQREAAPPLGRPPATGSTAPSSQRAGGSDEVARGQPIRIVGVVVDEVSEPLLDGTRGSGLYRVPLRLSRKPSAEWAGLFVRTWDHPPRFTTMHRPGIVAVQGDRVILDGTTMDEVERYHRDTLLLVLDEVNREIVKREASQQKRVETERQRREEHRRSVEAFAGRLSFDSNVPSGTQAQSAAPIASRPAGAQVWSIEGPAAEVPPQGRDATGFAWKLRRGDETRSIVVWISDSAMASADSALPPEVAQAKRTKGRSVLEALLSQESPPTEALVSTYGVRLG